MNCNNLKKVILLVTGYVLYLALGAKIFQFLEEPEEVLIPAFFTFIFFV